MKIRFYMKAKTLLLAAVMVSSMLFIASCGGGGSKSLDPTPTPTPTPTVSKQCTLSSFQFKAASNAGLATSPSAVIAKIQSRNLVLITVTEEVNLTSLIPTFGISDKATATIGGTAATSGVTAFNFTNDIDMVVTAEDGRSSNRYTILVKKGNNTIDSQVYGVMSKYNIPGISVACTKNEKLVFANGYGFANIDSSPKVKVTPNHLFRLASVSKAQTALCIMTLYEEGLLSPEDYVFAPAGANGAGSPEGILYSMYPGTHGLRVDKIKVKHLLTHTTGWNYNTTGGEDPIFTGDSRFYGKSLVDRVKYMVGTNTSNEPGSSYSYYNLGFCVLGQIIEKITGKSYETYLREVTAKAGVKDMWVARTKKAERRENECVYYSQTAGNDGYGNDMTVVAACGAVIASAPDLMQVLCSEDYGTVVPDILKKETLDMMYTNWTSSSPGGYGYGWRIGHNTLTNWASYHGGNIAGTATIWARGKNGVNGVLLCNSRSNISDFDTAIYVALNSIMGTIYSSY